MANAEQIKTLGRYNIERVLGKGAMGVVYEGVDPRLGRRVAIKTILKSALDEDTGKDFAMRFVREAQAVARLNHPNVVQVFDFGEEGDVAYIVMEFIRGKELKSFFDANERFDLKEAVRIMCELCDALDFAHEAGIVHRDIKPANVMIDSQGRTKLTDFGVARVQDNDKTSVEKTQAGTMVGTPAYMSPEQITGGNIDRRTDIFSAGIILYQFLTGEKPFTGSGAWTIAKKIIQEDPPLPSSLNNAITPVFDAVVNKALAKNVDERFQTARDLGAALKRALEGKGLEDDSDKTVVGGGIIDLDATMKGPAMMPSPAAAAKSPTATASAGTQQGSQEVELEFWRAIKDGNDPDDFELYVQQFPTGIYAALAKRKIAKLKGVSAPEDSKATAEQEKREAAEAAAREADARRKLAEEKEKLELELAQKEEEYKRREAERDAQRAAEEQARQEAIEKAKQEAAAERERAKQEAAAERERARQEAAAEAEKAKQEAAAALAAERERAKAEAEKAKQEAAAERERAKAEAEKARLEAEKAKKEAEEKAPLEAEQARKEAAAERERAKLEAEKARKETEEKAKKEAEALAKKASEERAKREAEFKKREAELKAQAAAGGKKASPVVAIAVGLVVLAISGTGYYFFAPDDKAAQEQLKAMQAELQKAQQAQEQARVALEKAKEAEEKAKRDGDVAKMKELAEQRLRAEAEAKKTADAAKAREVDAKKGEESGKSAKEKQLAEQKAKEEKAKADEKARAEQLARAERDKAERERAAKELADARAAAEKAKADAERIATEARAAAEKARADAEKAKQEAAAAAEKAKREAEQRQKVASAAAPAGGASALFEQAAALEQEGKGAEAVRTYIKAARGGSGPAAKRLGEIYDKGIDGVSRDYAESLKWRNAARVLGEDVPTAKSRN